VLVFTIASCSKPASQAKYIGIWEHADGRIDVPMNVWVIQENGIIFSRSRDGTWGQFFYDVGYRDGKEILHFRGQTADFHVALDFTSNGDMQVVPTLEDGEDGKPVTYRRARDEAALLNDLETQIRNSPAST